MSRRQVLGVAVLLLLATLAAYSPLRDAGFIWDDDDYVTGNTNLRSAEGLRRIWLEPGATHQYYPLVHSSFWLEYQLWGVAPLGYHLVNVLLHVANALLLWVVLLRLRVPGALLAAAIFALHPVHVESVAWVTERKNVLSGLFYLLALLAWMRFRPPGDTKHGGRLGSYGLAVVLLGCALLSKTVTCSLPAVILLLMWWKQRRLTIRDLLPLVPMFALGLVAGAVTVWMERTSVGASGAAWELSWVERCLIAGRALWFYAVKLVWPVELTFIYPRWDVRVGAAWQYLFPVTAVAVVVALWAACRQTRRGVVVAVLVFAGTLVPALGFIDIYPMRYSFVADHFQYLASIGLIALFAAAVARTLGDGASALVRPGGRVAAASLLLLLAVLTWRQARIYRDIETLWQDTVAKNPAAWMAHTNLGNILAERGELAAAAASYDAALLHEPDHVEAHNNMGLVLVRQGRLHEAAVHFERAVQIDPTFAESHHNLATARIAQGLFEEAVAGYAEALRLAPGNVDALFNQARALIRLGRLDQASERLREVIRLRPDDATAHGELGQALGLSGRTRQAVVHYREAIRLGQDGRSLNNLAWILATDPDPELRDGDEAVRMAELACRRSEFSEPGQLDTLAAGLAEAGRFDEADRTVQKAIDLALAAGSIDAAGRYAARQALYRRQQPYRDGGAAVTAPE